MLPRKAHPTITTTLPSTGKPVKFRPMTAREEKLLLMAKVSGEDEEILSTVRAVVSSCVLDQFDAVKAPVFDIEWLFIQIRIASVGEVVEVSYVDSSDGEVYPFEINLKNVTIEKPEVDNKVKFDEDVLVTLRWPSSDDYVTASKIAQHPELMAQEVVLSAIDKVFVGDTVTDAQKEPREELRDWVDSFDLESYKKIIDFLSSTPSLHYSIKYTNKNGEEREIVLSKLSDFFVFA